MAGNIEVGNIRIYNASGSSSTTIIYDTDSTVAVASGLKVAGNIVSNSDERLKSNIRDIENPLDIVKQLNGKRYTKDNEETIGLIAQEVEKVLPEMVHTENTEEGIKSVNYQNIIAVLIEAIKEQQKQIEFLLNK